MVQGGSFEIPRLRAIAAHATPRVIEGTVIPLVLFLVMLHFAGVWGALAVGVGWTYGAIGLRIATGRRVPGILLLGALTTTARGALAVATHSVFLYFLQPTLGTALVGGAFLVSFAAGRPLTERLAHDFCPLPEAMSGHPQLKRFFLRISLLWAGVFLANATLTLWLLLSQSLTVYVLAKPVVSFGFTAIGICTSVWWFRRSIQGHGVLDAHAVPAAAA